MDKYKVVRTWFVDADSTVEAISKTKEQFCDQVEALRHHKNEKDEVGEEDVGIGC